MISLVAAWGMWQGNITGKGRQSFSWSDAKRAIGSAKWELALPAVVLGALFSGRATLVETSALTALYAVIVTGIVHRDFVLTDGLRKAFGECIVLIGGVLVILAVAKGFTAYMVDVDIPYRLLEWTQARIDSPLLFLLALNVFLLLVGFVMDIFSAIVVVVPLIVRFPPTIKLLVTLKSPVEQNLPLSLPAVWNTISSLSEPAEVSADTYVS